MTDFGDVGQARFRMYTLRNLEIFYDVNIPYVVDHLYVALSIVQVGTFEIYSGMQVFIFIFQRTSKHCSLISNRN